MTIIELTNKAAEYQEKYSSMVNSYNKKQSLLLATYPDALKDYKPEYIQNQLQLKLKTNAIDEKATASEFIKGAESYLWNASHKKNDIKYPLRAENDINKKILAESIYQRAFNFLAATKDLNKIEAEVNYAMQVDDNYFSSLMDIIEAKKESDSVKFSQLDQKELDFYKRLDDINLKFELKTGLTEVNKTINAFSDLQKKGISFLNALSGGIVNYYDADTVKTMNANQVKDIVDHVNASSEFWQN